MNNSHVVELLKTLSKREFSNLLDFINSPFYVFPDKRKIHKTISKKDIVSLYTILKKEYPKFEGPGIDRKVIFKKLYPARKFDDEKFRNIKYGFSGMLEMYLSIIDMTEDYIESRLHFLNQLRKRRTNEQFRLTLNNLNVMLDKSDLRNDEYYSRKLLLAENEWLFEGKDENLKNSEAYMKALQNGMGYATNSFVMTMFKQLHYYHHYKHHLVTHIDTQFYDYVFRYFNDNKTLIENNPVLEILYAFLEIKTGGPDKSVLMKLKDQLNSSERNFIRPHYQFLYVDLYNICLEQYLKNESDYRDILVEVLKDCIQKDIYLEDGFIHEHSYKSIVSAALRLKEMRLAETLINSYKEMLPVKIREDAFSYNYASYYFINKEYEKALDYLSKVKNNDFYYTTEIYNLQLRIYFELNSLEPALNLIDSYKHFFSHSRQLPKEYQIRYKNFLDYFEKLLKIKMGETKKEAGLLRIKLNKEKEVAFKGWLVGKLNELEK